MIIKNYELKKLNDYQVKFYLLYGENAGYKKSSN